MLFSPDPQEILQLLLRLLGCNKTDTISSPRILNPRPSSGVRLQDTSIVEAKLSSRGNTSVASMYQTLSCMSRLSSRGSMCIKLCPRGQSCLHAPSTYCGPDVCDIHTSYVSRQCTSSDGDSAASCLPRRLAPPDWLVLAS
ncbi:hypothetical protein Tco_1502593 [Tanacetum coccineum]